MLECRAQWRAAGRRLAVAVERDGGVAGNLQPASTSGHNTATLTVRFVLNVGLTLIRQSSYGPCPNRKP